MSGPAVPGAPGPAPPRAAGRRRVSLCLIARDEERLLPGCLESVRGAVDEIVLVDTGSADATREIAARHGARVYERPWDDDFAAPRNLALSHATGDWILQLDADERLAPGASAGIRRAVEAGLELGALRLHNAARPDAGAAEVLSGRQRIGEPLYLPRLVRRFPDLRYRGVIHESLDDSLGPRGIAPREVDADIIHLGAVPGARAAQGKAERNLRLLERRCALEPDSTEPLAYLASELHELGRVAQAEAVAERGWGLLSRQPAWRPVHQLAVTRAFLAQARGDVDRVLETAAAAEERQGPTPDLSFLRGCALESRSLRLAGPEALDHLAQAEAAYREALAPRPGGGRSAPFVKGADSWNARLRLGTVLLRRGRAAEARSAFAAAAGEAPDPREARLGNAEALLDEGQAAEALGELEPLLDPRPDGWILAAAAARRLGREAEVSRYLAGARERLPAGLVAPHRAVRARAIAGTPAPDFAGLLAALMERREVSAGDRGAPVDLALLQRLAADFLERGQAGLLVPLLEPAAEAACPGLPGWVRGVLAELGAEVVEDGDGEAG